MKDFLSTQMAKNRAFNSERARKFGPAFRDAARVSNEILESPFRPRGPLNAATLEAVMGVLLETRDEINLTKETYELLIEDERFLEAAMSNTTHLDQVRSRRDIALKILKPNA